MLPANKHLDPIIGVDIHITLLPTPAGPVPVPLPYPFIGMVLDPMDYVPVVGAKVMVNKKPRGNSTTSGMLGTKVHIPMGGPLQMAATIGHDSANFFGSPRVVTEGSYTSGSGFMVMSCNDIGMPLTATPGKKMKPKFGMYLPTSATIPIPSGPPVIVGGPYVPDLMAIVMSLVMSFGMGSLMKAAGKGLKKLNHAVLKKFPATQGLSKKLCKLGFEPVDLITGRVIYDGEDFRIPGVIPLEWKRNWYSDSGYKGLMGHGVHCNYDIALHIEESDQQIVMRLSDGRVTSFPLLIAEGDSFYHRSEKLTLTCIDANTYTVKDNSTELTNTFERILNDLFKPVSISNNDGFALQFNYDSIGNLQQIIDTAKRKINLSLDSEGRITAVNAIHEGEHRNFISYTYNEEGDLTKITDALGKTTHIEYKNHLMIKKTDRNGQAFYWEYDGKKTGAKCIKTWGDGGILAGSIQYNKGHNVITNSLGDETIYYFDDNNLCTQVTDAEGGHTFHEYTDFMEPYRDIDEMGNTTGYTYNDRGDLTGIHKPDGSVIMFVYDEKDRLILTQDQIGGSTIRTFKDNNRLHAIVAPNDALTSFEYHPNGLIESIRDNVGNVTSMTYDTDHNLSKMILSNGTSSIWKYDAWGRCIQNVNPEKHKQQFFYDELDRIEKIQKADNNILKLKYNSYDEIIETIDSTKHTVQFDYTPLGNLKMREESGAKVHFKYNTEESLVAINNERDEYYLFGRNRNGQIINETGFDGLRRDYLRDRAGKVLRIDRPDDRFTEYEYDLNGKITRAEYYDGTWETYSYDNAGNLIEAVNQDSIVSFERDSAGRIVKEIQDGHSVESEFDALSNRIKLESSLGANIEIKRSDLGYIESINAEVLASEENKEENTKGKSTWEASFAYNSIGQELQRILPGGIKTEMEYDKAGRPLSQKVSGTNRVSRHRNYTWDVSDKLKKMVDGISSGSTSYGYDQFNSLAWAKYEDKQMDYKLPDKVGNLYRSKDQRDRKYGSGGKLLESNGNKFTYDEEGSLIKKITNRGDWEYNWFGNGLLKSVLKPDGTQLSFEYDALARRVAKIRTPKNPSKPSYITRFVWDRNIPLHEWKYDLNDRPKPVINEDGLLDKDKNEPINDLITWIFDEGTFKPAAKIVNGETFSIITNYLGTPVEMYNASGEKTWEVEYDIYGKIRKQLKGNSSDCPFRYQGQYEDSETGLYYNRYRFYSPDVGIYINQDPIRLRSHQLNFYFYVWDTNKWVDEFGLTGTYFFTDGSTSYVGKGASTRMKASMKQRVGGESNVTQGLHVDYGNNDMGLMVEAELMERHNAVSDTDFHNAINSPGKKKLADAKLNNPALYNQVIKNADDFEVEYGKTVGVKCK